MGETGNDFSTILQLRLSTTHPLILSDLGMDSAAFMAFCQENPEIRIERNTSGQIIAMPPTSSETGRINASIAGELYIWNRTHRPGVVFDSSTGFHLSNGADRSPDTSWIKKERWEALTTAQKTKFAPIAPDFVVELRSADQSIHDLRSKMEEYISCGVRLGWLVDPTNKCTYVYTENGFIQTFPFETQLTGEDVLPGFSLRMIDLF
jgi:Uma2 family endonuclease